MTTKNGKNDVGNENPQWMVGWQIRGKAGLHAKSPARRVCCFYLSKLRENFYPGRHRLERVARTESKRQAGTV